MNFRSWVCPPLKSFLKRVAKLLKCNLMLLDNRSIPSAHLFVKFCQGGIEGHLGSNRTLEQVSQRCVPRFFLFAGRVFDRWDINPLNELFPEPVDPF